LLLSATTDQSTAAGAGAQQQRRSATNAGSVMLTAELTTLNPDLFYPMLLVVTVYV